MAPDLVEDLLRRFHAVSGRVGPLTKLVPAESSSLLAQLRDRLDS